MIDSQSLFRWGAGFLIGTGFIDFFRFGTFKLQTNDWLSVGMAIRRERSLVNFSLSK